MHAIKVTKKDFLLFRTDIVQGVMRELQKYLAFTIALAGHADPEHAEPADDGDEGDVESDCDVPM